MTRAPQVLATGLRFPEGPTLSADGRTLYCVNIHAEYLSHLDLETQTLTREWVTLPDGGRGNGSTLGPDGALYVADVGARRILRISLPEGRVTTVADGTEAGGALRGPNDLIFDARGGLYFSDPQGSWDAPTGAVYRVAPATHAVSLVADGFQFPNGLVLSPDDGTLYVAETPRHRVVALDLLTGARRVFAMIGERGGPDGMRWGRDGSLYAAVYGEDIVAQVSPAGTVIRRYPVPGGDGVTNLCFAADGASLYVTEAASHAIVQVFL